MPRRKVIEELKKCNLKTLIPEYGKLNIEYLELGKVKKARSEEIKTLMMEENQTEVSAGGYVAKLSASTTESFNEDKFIPDLLDKYATINKKYKIVKTRNYIDYDALENAIYHEAFENVAELNKYKETSIVNKLTVKKEK